MFCAHCGRQAADDATFCSTCGKPILRTAGAPDPSAAMSTAASAPSGAGAAVAAAAATQHPQVAPQATPPSDSAPDVFEGVARRDPVTPSVRQDANGSTKSPPSTSARRASGRMGGRVMNFNARTEQLA